MSSCLLTVTMVTTVSMVTRRCELCFDQQFCGQCVCRTDSTEFKTDPGSYRDMCTILLLHGNLSNLAQIYTDHGTQAILLKHVRCNKTREWGGAWRKDSERLREAE